MYNNTYFNGTQISATNFPKLDLQELNLTMIGTVTLFIPIGDIVRYGGYLYSAVNTTQDSQHLRITTLNANGDVIKEAVGGDPYKALDNSAKTNDFVGDWSIKRKILQTGDIVQRGGFLYEAVRDINLQDGDDSSANHPDPEVWLLLAKGQRWKAQWTPDTLYSEEIQFIISGSAYTCTNEHTSVIPFPRRFCS